MTRIRRYADISSTEDAEEIRTDLTLKRNANENVSLAKYQLKTREISCFTNLHTYNTMLIKVSNFLPDSVR